MLTKIITLLRTNFIMLTRQRGLLISSLGYAVIFKSIGNMFSHQLTSVDSIYFKRQALTTQEPDSSSHCHPLRNHKRERKQFPMPAERFARSNQPGL